MAIDRRKITKSQIAPHRCLLLSGLFLLLTGCNYPGYATSIPPTIPAPTSTQIRLPDTWTPQPASPTPQFTATRSSSLTPSLTSTLTPLGVTNTPTPLAVNLTPSPTTDFLQPPYPDCSYRATKPGVRLLQAPFVDPYRVLPTMEPQKDYTAVVDKPTYTLLLDGDQPAGWVDYRLVALEMEGNDCLTRRDPREITDFPNLCLFATSKKITTYTSPDLTETGLHELYPDNLYILLLQYQQAYFSSFGHAGPSFYVARADVETLGDCQDVPAGGMITATTGLYSEPDGTEFNLIINMSENQAVYIQNRTESGNPPPDATTDGEWVQVRLPVSAGGYEGWCWSEFLEYK